MTKLVRQFLRNENGATAIEYGLIVTVLSLAIIGGVSQAAKSLEFLWADNNSRLQQGLQ